MKLAIAFDNDWNGTKATGRLYRLGGTPATEPSRCDGLVAELCRQGTLILATLE